MSIDEREYATNEIHRLGCEVRLKDETIHALLREVQELKEGACRYNCRTSRAMWITGFRVAASNTNYRVSNAREVYNEWQRQQT